MILRTPGNMFLEFEQSLVTSKVFATKQNFAACPRWGLVVASVTALHGFCFYAFVALSLDTTTSRKFVLLGWRPCRPDVVERFSVLAPSKPQYYNEHRCHCGSKGSGNVTFAIIGAVLYAQLKGSGLGRRREHTLYWFFRVIENKTAIASIKIVLHQDLLDSVFLGNWFV